MGLIPAGIGLLVACRIGLQLLLFEKFIVRKQNEYRLWNILREALIIAFLLGIIGVIFQAVTKPMIVRDLAKLGVDAEMIVQNNNPAPWWAMSLLAFSAGIVEEVAFRLGLLSLLAWLGSLIWKPKEGKLRNGVFWSVNIIIAVLFSLAHFANIQAAGIPLTVGLVLRNSCGKFPGGPGVRLAVLETRPGKRDVDTYVFGCLCLCARSALHRDIFLKFANGTSSRSRK